MDDSVDEGDSLFSVPGRPNIQPRALYQTPPQLVTSRPEVGVSFHASVVPQQLPEYDESFEQPNRWVEGASPPDISTSTSYGYDQDEQEEGVEGVEERDGEPEEQEGSYEASEGSSAQYDPDTDPEGFAQRLDELAGVLEITPAESNAIKWGLPLSKKQKPSNIPIDSFRKLVNHHLDSTEWRYDSTKLVTLPILGRSIDPNMIEDSDDMHPIRVFGRGWTEKDDWLEPEPDDMEVDPSGLLDERREFGEGLYAN
ncbi:uncharacterized protein L201_002038 [Kwoniella dendrophila CBS 6074]|uniref:Uncharacterized protein n=1 Tax=Kwoniella dendrophila CBS 6074 TaxID=1295534 RepID=A0AAX4JP60_9TREE